MAATGSPLLVIVLLGSALGLAGLLFMARQLGAAPRARLTRSATKRLPDLDLTPMERVVAGRYLMEHFGMRGQAIGAMATMALHAVVFGLFVWLVMASPALLASTVEGLGDPSAGASATVYAASIGLLGVTGGANGMREAGEPLWRLTAAGLRVLVPLLLALAGAPVAVLWVLVAAEAVRVSGGMAMSGIYRARMARASDSDEAVKALAAALRAAGRGDLAAEVRTTS